MHEMMHSFWSSRLLGPFAAHFVHLGCYKDLLNHSMTLLDGKYDLVDDDAFQRKYPVEKCAVVALYQGYSVFALQNGGQCYSGPDAESVYDQHGPAVNCTGGLGGSLANDVYKLQGR